MQRIDHPLLSPSLGSHKTLTSFHFGQPANRAQGELKIYIHARLHAEELPGMLTAYHLRPLLEASEAAGQLVGEIVLVPVSNPIVWPARPNQLCRYAFSLFAENTISSKQ